MGMVADAMSWKGQSSCHAKSHNVALTTWKRSHHLEGFGAKVLEVSEIVKPHKITSRNHTEARKKNSKTLFRDFSNLMRVVDCTRQIATSSVLQPRNLWRPIRVPQTECVEQVMWSKRLQ